MELVMIFKSGKLKYERTVVMRVSISTITVHCQKIYFTLWDFITLVLATTTLQSRCDQKWPEIISALINVKFGGFLKFPWIHICLFPINVVKDPFLMDFKSIDLLWFDEKKLRFKCNPISAFPDWFNQSLTDLHYFCHLYWITHNFL